MEIQLGNPRQQTVAQPLDKLSVSQKNWEIILLILEILSILNLCLIFILYLDFINRPKYYITYQNNFPEVLQEYPDRNITCPFFSEDDEQDNYKPIKSILRQFAQNYNGINEIDQLYEDSKVYRDEIVDFSDKYLQQELINLDTLKWLNDRISIHIGIYISFSTVIFEIIREIIKYFKEKEELNNNLRKYNQQLKSQNYQENEVEKEQKKLSCKEKIQLKINNFRQTINGEWEQQQHQTFYDYMIPSYSSRSMKLSILLQVLNIYGTALMSFASIHSDFDNCIQFQFKKKDDYDEYNNLYGLTFIFPLSFFLSQILTMKMEKDERKKESQNWIIEKDERNYESSNCILQPFYALVSLFTFFGFFGLIYLFIRNFKEYIPVVVSIELVLTIYTLTITLSIKRLIKFIGTNP